MNDTTCGPRLAHRHDQITKLTARRAEITDTINHRPRAPPPATIDHIRALLARVITNGTPAERKAVIEALVAEIRIDNEKVIPVFKIPGPDAALPDNAKATDGEPTVRTMVRSVDRTWLHTNRVSAAQGPTVTVPAVRARRV